MITGPAWYPHDIASGTPDSPALYKMIARLGFESLESFQNAFGPVGAELMGDIPNFTHVEPKVEIGSGFAV